MVLSYCFPNLDVLASNFVSLKDCLESASLSEIVRASDIEWQCSAPFNARAIDIEGVHICNSSSLVPNCQ